MRYVSTRGEVPPLTFSEAVATGLAPDGGLYLPEKLPYLAPFFPQWEKLNYTELAQAFFQIFANDIDVDLLNEHIADAYSRFDHPDIAPLHRLDEQTQVLELFHGPTLAFKDFALQLLGNLYALQIERTGEPINILGATSGDTGAAAIHGLLNKPGVCSFILYPEGGVSPLQERQMTCTGADNVHPIAIRGSFDDAQRIIKQLFGDLELRRSYRLSAVNSINLARILAQCVYYLFAWFRLTDTERKDLEFVVPTGNFGNVLAGWLTHRMGMPVNRFRIATNQNDILHRLFTTGEYRQEPVRKSVAPSMDIQIASNFEHFLYYHEKGDSRRVKELVEAFQTKGAVAFEQFDGDIFTSSSADDAEIGQWIREIDKRHGYLMDPHTACGFAGWDKPCHRVVLSTAHPAKFPETIESAVGRTPRSESLDRLMDKPIRKVVLDAEPEAIRSYIQTHAQTSN